MLRYDEIKIEIFGTFTKKRKFSGNFGKTIRKICAILK